MKTKSQGTSKVGEKRSIPINLSEIPPRGKVILRINGEFYHSYYRTKDKLFVKPIDHDQTT